MGLLQQVSKATQTSREHMAKQVFKAEKVEKKILERAAAGYGFLEICAPHGVNLTETAAAASLITHLKHEGIESGFVWVDLLHYEPDQKSISSDTKRSWLQPNNSVNIERKMGFHVFRVSWENGKK